MILIALFVSVLQLLGLMFAFMFIFFMCAVIVGMIAMILNAILGDPR